VVNTLPVDDVLHRFLLEEAGVRGVLVRLGPAWREVAGRADYPPALHALLGEALAASALLTGNIKLDGALSIELKSSGGLRLLFAECNDRDLVRGLARSIARPAAPSHIARCDHGDHHRQRGARSALSGAG
jgi:molecular chaperone Hsp33